MLAVLYKQFVPVLESLWLALVNSFSKYFLLVLVCVKFILVISEYLLAVLAQHLHLNSLK
jgi:hypothetical protein